MMSDCFSFFFCSSLCTPYVILSEHRPRADGGEEFREEPRARPDGGGEPRARSRAARIPRPKVRSAFHTSSSSCNDIVHCEQCATELEVLKGSGLNLVDMLDRLLDWDTHTHTLTCKATMHTHARRHPRTHPHTSTKASEYLLSGAKNKKGHEDTPVERTVFKQSPNIF